MQPIQQVWSEAAGWPGGGHSRLERPGLAQGPAQMGPVWARLLLAGAGDRASLKRLARRYQAQVLVPLELPAIEAARGHAGRNELRELIALDRELSQEPRLEGLAAASRRAGRDRLRKLAPLRDQRLAQRYGQAVEAGQAHGWHLLVYGLELEIFSLALRPGLLAYARQTTWGVIQAAGRRLRLSDRDRRQLLEELCAGFPRAVEELLKQRAAA